MKGLMSNHSNLKAAIINAFQISEIHIGTIEFMIEEIFKSASDDSLTVRKACLATMNHFKSHSSRDSISYLKASSCLPFFYQFLNDKDA